MCVLHPTHKLSADQSIVIHEYHQIQTNTRPLKVGQTGLWGLAMNWATVLEVLGAKFVSPKGSGKKTTRRWCCAHSLRSGRTKVGSLTCCCIAPCVPLYTIWCFLRNKIWGRSIVQLYLVHTGDGRYDSEVCLSSDLCFSAFLPLRGRDCTWRSTR